MKVQAWNWFPGSQTLRAERSFTCERSCPSVLLHDYTLATNSIHSLPVGTCCRRSCRDQGLLICLCCMCWREDPRVAVKNSLVIRVWLPFSEITWSQIGNFGVWILRANKRHPKHHPRKFSPFFSLKFQGQTFVRDSVYVSVLFLQDRS